jgi:hypothetical protein
VVQQAQLAPISAEELAKRSKLAIWQSLQRAGYNPQFSYLGRQLLDRSERLTPLAMASLGNDANAVDKFGSFSDAYSNAMLKGGTGGGGFDLSRTGQRNAINSAFQNATPGSDMYGFLTSGDPEEQFNRWRGFEQAAQSGRFAPLVEANLANKQAEFTNFLGNQLSGGGNPNQNWLDYAMGRPGPGPGATTPAATPPGAAGPGATTPATGTPGTPGAASTAYSQSASGPQGSLTPPVNPGGAVNPNLSTFPSAPGLANAWTPTGPSVPGGAPYATPGATPPATGTPNATPGAPGAPTTWKQLLDTYRGDQRNWGTRGYRPTPQAFNIGGIGYNPAADQVSGYNNMSGQGRVTNRGNFMGQFMYYLDLLMRQRDGTGNTALGITNQTTDQQLAQIAAQRMGKNAIGSTGISGV